MEEERQKRCRWGKGTGKEKGTGGKARAPEPAETNGEKSVFT